VIDWLWSIGFYTSVIFALVGAFGVVRPLRRVHRGRRLHAAVMLLIGLAAAYAISRSMPHAQTSTERHAIDEFTPVFHFREHHDTTIAAPPARVFEAIRAVTADEIALFRTFTWIRRFGQPGPDSIINAPGRQPILDVATRGGFLLLHEAAPHEIVVGTAVIAPPGTPRPDGFGAPQFKALQAPGFVLATMNFRVEAMGGASHVSTETRVFATDQASLRRFTAYWRVIFPGSAILRVTWLRAIKQRAEHSA
jgi:hypothetical protein